VVCHARGLGVDPGVERSELAVQGFGVGGVHGRMLAAWVATYIKY
jgi:hypothetical protein